MVEGSEGFYEEEAELLEWGEGGSGELGVRSMGGEEVEEEVESWEGETCMSLEGVSWTKDGGVAGAANSQNRVRAKAENNRVRGRERDQMRSV